MFGFGGGMWARKSQTFIGLADHVWFGVVVIYAACDSTVTSLGVSSASFRVVA